MAGLFLWLIPTLFAVIGLIIGLVKGFTRVQTWAGEYVVSAMLTIAIGAILNASGASPTVGGIVIIVCAVVFMLGCMGLSKLFQRIIRRSMEKRDEEMRKYGGVGVINRLWGGLVLAIKGFTIAMLIIVPVYIVLDLAHVESLQNSMAGVYGGGFWRGIKGVAFDFIVIGVMNIAIRHGFSNGISSSFWSLIVFGLAIGAGFMSYHLVFNSGLFASANAALGEVVLGWFGGVNLPGEMQLDGIAVSIAKWMITAGLFLLLLIVVMLISFFVSRVLSFARLGSAFYVADGISGAIVMFIIFVGILLLLGCLVQPIADLDFMQPFTSYFNVSTVAKYFYQQNLLSSMGVPALIPLRDWLS